MPSVIILWGKTLNGNGATVKLLCQVRVAKQFLQRKAVSFDPILGGQIDSGICCESAVCDTAHNLCVIGLINWPGIRPELTAKEFIEVLVFGRIRLLQLTESVLQLKSLFTLSMSAPYGHYTLWCHVFGKKDGLLQ